jgi:hypothetical protein
LLLLLLLLLFWAKSGPELPQRIAAKANVQAVRRGNLKRMPSSLVVCDKSIGMSNGRLWCFNHTIQE